MASGAAAQVLPPGQEAVVVRMLSVDACELESASIDHATITAHYLCPAPVTVRLVHPSRSDSADRTDRFAIEGAPDTLRDSLLASIRQQEGAIEWVDPRRVHRREVVEAEREMGACESVVNHGPTWALAVALGLLLAWLRPRLDVDRRFVLLLLGLVALTLLVAEPGPLHDHLTFTARSDCARSPCCDHERPGWLPPAYHLLEPLLNVLPYRSATLWGLSLAFTILSLVFQYASLRRLLARWDAKGHVALLATLLVGSNPVVMRMALAHSWYPFMMALVWCATWVCLWAAEEGGLARWTTAAIAVGLAGTTTVSAVPIAALVGAGAALGSRRRKAAWPMALGWAFIGVHAWGFVADTAGVAPRLDVSIWLRDAFFDARAVPLVVPFLAAAGLLFLARRKNFVGVALGLGFFAMLPTVDYLDRGYPFLSVYPMIQGSLALSAIALVAAFRFRPALGAVLALALVVTTATATEAWTFTHVPRPLAAELRGLESSWDALPPHERLVIPPEYFPPLPHVRRMGDPVEARFPVGFYEAAMRARGRRPAEIVAFDRWLAEGAPTQDTLVYLGTGFFSFLPSEIAHGAPAERPLLSRARAHLHFEPVQVFSVPTDNHRFGRMRVTADRAPEVVVGFYRPVREGD